MITPEPLRVYRKSQKWQEIVLLMIEEFMQNWDNACNKQKLL